MISDLEYFDSSLNLSNLLNNDIHMLDFINNENNPMDFLDNNIIINLLNSDFNSKFPLLDLPEENKNVSEENKNLPEENKNVPEENKNLPEENKNLPEENKNVSNTINLFNTINLSKLRENNKRQRQLNINKASQRTRKRQKIKSKLMDYHIQFLHKNIKEIIKLLKDKNRNDLILFLESMHNEIDKYTENLIKELNKV